MRNKFFLAQVLLLCYLSSYTQNVSVIPRPQEVAIGKRSFVIDTEVSIVSSDISNEVAFVLQSYYKDIFGLEIEVTKQKQKRIKTILFKLDHTLKEEAYELVVSNKEIKISASNDTGWFYALQSLRQLFFDGVSTMRIPEVKIKDSPRFSWRAFMLDEGRYFKGMDQVKLLLDEMALLKMNVFHWHLVDDEGWRIEIKKYPLLTKIGSKRKSSQIGPLEWHSPIQSAEPHEGYYTQVQIKEIIEYAEERHITIVPEIEMPGHSSAAIASYPWLSTTNKDIEVPIKFGLGLGVYNVSDPKVYEFITDVLSEVIDLFPSKTIHIGGDEVGYDDWKASKSAQDYMKEHGLTTPAELQLFFTNNISHFLEDKGRRMMGWNEVLGDKIHEKQNETDMKSKISLAQNTLVHFWKGDTNLIIKAADKGYNIVNSLHTNTYLDYNYDRLPLSKAYAFDPVPKDLNPEYSDRIIGTGCQMWGEWIPTNGQMHFQVFPRIAAFAEVGWTETTNKDFTNFKVALKNLEKHWNEKGIYYAPDVAVEKSNDIDDK